LLKEAQADVDERLRVYQQLAQQSVTNPMATAASVAATSEDKEA
jgi:hypothetical protein